MDQFPSVRILPTIQPWLTGNTTTLCQDIKTREPNIDIEPIIYTHERAQELNKAEILITNEISNYVLKHAGNVKWIQVLSAGITKYPLEKLKRRGIIITSASGIHSEPIAEQVMGYILLFERRILDAINQQAQKQWRRYTGGEISGKTLGIVGLGVIGQRVAEIAAALGMEVIGTKRTPTHIHAVSEVYEPDKLGIVLSESDYLVLACPLTESTSGLIRRREYDAMKENAVLINIARGEIAPQDALIEAIQSRRIQGAAIDVFESEPLAGDSPLWNLSNVVITPHSAGTTPEYLPRCAEIFVENYRHFVEENTEDMRNRVM